MLKESLDPFLNTDEFAVEATLSINGVASTIKVIFDLAYEFSSIDAEGRSITALAKSSDLTALRHGDTLIIAPNTYSVVGIQPEAEGTFTELILKEAA
ncbi:MAG: hypothetical protein HC934_02940 [Acaryochloridaceae cyanobacterium SU_2_1]|nr:hypothetical protein [Acaryochloridaceae cyanobacterium SU_2_1]